MNTSRTRTLLAGAAVVALFALALVLLWWRGPEWGSVAAVFTVVAWWWIVAALALNLVSVLARAQAWRTVVGQALPQSPGFGSVFSAFAVGLLANAVLPGRIGELARVGVLRRRYPRRRGTTATLVGTVFVHRLFDLFPAVILVVYVLLTARIPHWAITALVIAAAVGVVLFAFALGSARLRPRPLTDATGTVRRLLVTAREGLGVLRAPLRAGMAALFQCAGWLLQLVAVYVAMRAFGIDAPLPAAALVLLLMNVATIFPLWPGNIGLLQAAVALPLVPYGVAATTGFAYGIGLQMLEMAVGVGVGLLFLAREGLSFASLRAMQDERGGDLRTVTPAKPRASERARVPG